MNGDTSTYSYVKWIREKENNHSGSIYICISGLKYFPVLQITNKPAENLEETNIIAEPAEGQGQHAAEASTSDKCKIWSLINNAT